MEPKDTLNAQIEVNPGSSPGPSPESSSLRARNARGHKPDCSCMVCRRIQAAIASGKPSKADLKARAEENRKLRKARLKARTEPITKREERIRQAALVQGALAGQIVAGTRPNIEKTAEIAGVSAPTAKKIAGEDFVQGALLRAGIDDTKLAQVAAEGLDAVLQRIVSDRDGNVVDVINVPDWKSRHSFWADLLRVKKILGGENETGGGGGGLVIITPDAARVLPGHAPTCSCDGCLRAWEEKTAHLRRAAMKERAILTSVVNSPQPPQPPIDAEETEVEEVEYDDFGPVE